MSRYSKCQDVICPKLIFAYYPARPGTKKVSAGKIRFLAGKIMCSLGKVKCSATTIKCSAGTIKCSAGTIKCSVGHYSGFWKIYFEIDKLSWYSHGQ